MKDQYFGDVNDYMKYGILRCCAEAGWRVGVCWMLTPNDGRSEGRKIGYLSDSRGWRDHDPALFDSLQRIVSGGDRQVAAANGASIIPGAQYFDDLVPDERGARTDWMTSAHRTLSSSDIIFFDPDNGLQVASKPKGRKDSSKYIFWDELEQTWNMGASLLVFQHFAREKRSEHAARLASQLLARAPGSNITRLTTPSVLFLLASRPQHADRTEAALDLLQARWGSRFRLVD